LLPFMLLAISIQYRTQSLINRIQILSILFILVRQESRVKLAN